MQMRLFLAFLAVALPTSFAWVTRDENGEIKLKTPPATPEEIDRKLSKFGYAKDWETGELKRVKDVKLKAHRKLQPGVQNNNDYNRADYDDGRIYYEYYYPECKTIKLVAKTEDILVGEDPTPTGEVNYFPIFDPFTFHPVGLYVEESTLIHDDDDFCVLNGSFNFDFDSNNDEYFSEITVATSCMAHFATITGGNGQFSCASGWQVFNEILLGSYVETDLFVCYAPCIDGFEVLGPSD